MLRTLHWVFALSDAKQQCESILIGDPKSNSSKLFTLSDDSIATKNRGEETPTKLTDFKSLSTRKCHNNAPLVDPQYFCQKNTTKLNKANILPTQSMKAADVHFGPVKGLSLFLLYLFSRMEILLPIQILYEISYQFLFIDKFSHNVFLQKVDHVVCYGDIYSLTHLRNIIY